jgi:hypothetical protein
MIKFFKSIQKHNIYLIQVTILDLQTVLIF